MKFGPIQPGELRGLASDLSFFHVGKGNLALLDMLLFPPPPRPQGTYPNALRHAQYQREELGAQCRFQVSSERFLRQLDEEKPKILQSFARKSGGTHPHSLYGFVVDFCFCFSSEASFLVGCLRDTNRKTKVHFGAPPKKAHLYGLYGYLLYLLPKWVAHTSLDFLFATKMVFPKSMAIILIRSHL